jgi:hypothetical protein
MRLLTANDIEDDDENEEDRRGEGSILANEDISRYKMSAVGALLPPELLIVANKLQILFSKFLFHHAHLSRDGRFGATAKNYCSGLACGRPGNRSICAIKYPHRPDDRSRERGIPHFCHVIGQDARTREADPAGHESVGSGLNTPQ